MLKFKDNFSKQAKDYSKYRPDYPPELFDYLVGLNTHKSVAWDCGTGNGQVARALAPQFNKVYATDPSEKQLSEAIPTKNVEYRRATAEQSGLESKTVDLTTVAQAFHWFNSDEFAKEVSRVSASGAHLAVWCYCFAKIEPKIEVVVNDFYRGTLKGYWDSVRDLVEEGYASVKLPFSEQKAAKFSIRREWTRENWVGYLGTWSAVQKFKDVNGVDPIPELSKKLSSLWPDGSQKVVEWPLSLRIWKV